MDRFAVCQAFAQLEADYNIGGWLRERPSNQRRNESIGCQLDRMGYANPYEWVDITAEAEPDDTDDTDDEDVRDIYLLNVLKWRLPISPELAAVIERRFAANWLARCHPDWREAMR